MIGTRDYIAPEVLRGEQATVRSDLYSCAMVLLDAFGDLLPAGPCGARRASRRRGSGPPARIRPIGPGGAGGLRQTDRSGRDRDGPARPPRDHTAGTIPIGSATAPSWLQPRLLGGLALLAALLVVGILLLNGGDEPSSPGERPSEATSETRDQDQARATGGEDVATTERPTVTETTRTETAETAAPAAPSGKPEKDKPEKVKPEKVKPPKPPKSPPGQDKGLREH